MIKCVLVDDKLRIRINKFKKNMYLCKKISGDV